VVVLTVALPAWAATQVPVIAPSALRYDWQRMTAVSVLSSGAHGWRGDGSVVMRSVLPTVTQIGRGASACPIRKVTTPDAHRRDGVVGGGVLGRGVINVGVADAVADTVALGGEPGGGALTPAELLPADSTPHADDTSIATNPSARGLVGITRHLLVAAAGRTARTSTTRAG